MTLNPVDVTGKTNLKLTVALAATDLDFETSDFLDIEIDPDGNGPEPFTTLAHFSAPSDNDKFFTDGHTRLGTHFQNVSYNIPDGATQLVVRFEATATWWNEIVGFDNVRITSGKVVAPRPTISLTKAADGWTLQFTGVLQQSGSATGPWQDVTGSPSSPLPLPTTGGAPIGFYRTRQP